MTVKFSIILPTYNRAHLLSKAIESVRAQSVSDWELIVIDDGSTDNTKDIVFSFGDKRILYGKQENRGRSSARNAGLHHASGEWVCFLDSDDWYLEDHLESFEKAISEYPTTKIFKTGVTFQDEKSQEISQSKFHFPQTDQLPFVLQNYCSVLDVCIQADIAKRVQFPHIDSWEDKAYLSVLLRAFPWQQIELRTVIALVHDERSILTSYKNIQGINNTLKIMEQCLSDVNYRDRYLGPVQQNFLLSVMVNASRDGKKTEEIKKIMKGVKKSIMPMTWVRYWKAYLLDGSKM